MTRALVILVSLVAIAVLAATQSQFDSTNAGPRWYSTAATNWVTASGTPDP